MPKYVVRVSMVEVYEITVVADSPAQAVEIVSHSDTDFSECCPRADNYWLDIDEEMDVTEVEITE